MEVIFLGTSSGTPTKTRNVSGIAIRRANAKAWSLIDCGEGTQQQILHTDLSLDHLTAIFITHVHGDHCYGLAGLLASTGMSGRTEPMLLVGPKPIQQMLMAIMENTQLKLSYEITFVDVLDINNPLNTREFTVETIELSHRVPSFAYVFSEKNIERKLNVKKLKAAGIQPSTLWRQLQAGEDVVLEDGSQLKSADYLLPSRPPRKIIIAGDNDTPTLLTDDARTANTVIHEATFTQDIVKRIGNGPQHSSAKMVAQFAEDISIANLVLTHFSPRYRDSEDTSPSIKDIENEAREFYTGNLNLAKDLETYHLDIKGHLTRVEAKK